MALVEKMTTINKTIANAGRIRHPSQHDSDSSLRINSINDQPLLKIRRKAMEEGEEEAEEDFSFPDMAAEHQFVCKLPFFTHCYQQNRSFASEAASGDEEKMDLLWEALNEELQRDENGGCGKRGDSDGSASPRVSEVERRRGEISCVRSFDSRRLGLALIFKMLRKMFFIQRRKTERRPPLSPGIN
ncbi:hypothetical protein AXF42_Ash000367 [Apostasia shenzhenica]|uniref:Uncharacterized protein n=1 Tax=Apostasia shenzhenica TaxID=1088818 RepID=A0A2I0AG54_9ASPA|nr:hypothetical protein AXF42_Ash000367 [Apostasia shenzhenica]